MQTWAPPGEAWRAAHPGPRTLLLVWDDPSSLLTRLPIATRPGVWLRCGTHAQGSLVSVRTCPALNSKRAWFTRWNAPAAVMGAVGMV